MVHGNTSASNSESRSGVLAVTRLKSVNVAQLKAALKEKRLSDTGNKDVLIKRLEGTLSSELWMNAAS